MSRSSRLHSSHIILRYTKRKIGGFDVTDLTYFFAFAAGLLSFISPCTLPLYPAFLSYITGVSTAQLTADGLRRKQALLHTIAFLVGFSLIFIVLGFSTSFIRVLFIQYDELIRQLGGILIVIFGLIVAGVFKPTLLMKEHRFQLKNRPTGYAGSALIGLVFAAGWTPCTGPILASIFLLGSTNPTSAVSYMLLYVLGFSVPFLVMAFFLPKIQLLKHHMQRVVTLGGYVMIVVGILIFFDQLSKLNQLFTPIFGDFTGF